jgi:HSP20 family molecular chaperone IbpA
METRMNFRSTRDSYIYTMEVPGVSVLYMDVILERYNSLWYQMFVNITDPNSNLRGKHLVTSLTFEYLKDIQVRLSNGLLTIEIADPYKDPIHLPIRRVVE